MAKDLFGGLMKSFAGMSDDINAKLVGAQAELDDYLAKERDVYAELGRTMVEAQGADAFPEYAEQLQLAQMNVQAAEGKLNALKQEKQMAEDAKKERDSLTVCPNCGHDNGDATKFCQECGTKLGAPAKSFCTACGSENPPGTRFCGNCGARQGE